MECKIKEQTCHKFAWILNLRFAENKQLHCIASFAKVDFRRMLFTHLTVAVAVLSQGILRSECTTEVIMAGFIWDNMPLVEKAIDAIDFSRIREGVKINKFPGFLDLNRFSLTNYLVLC